MHTQSNNDRNTSTPVPRWLTVGAWVTPRYGMIPLRVEKIYIDENVLAKNNKGEMFAGHFSQLRPLRFRPYCTYDEAKEVLGKIIEYKDSAVLVTAFRKVCEGLIYFNWKEATDFPHDTIVDGHPFGVPEVDTDAEAQA